MNKDRVINVIGNASSLLDQDYAEAIDDNFTIRINVPEIEKHKDKLGSRIDAIFSEYIKNKNAEYRIWNPNHQSL